MPVQGPKAKQFLHLGTKAEVEARGYVPTMQGGAFSGWWSTLPTYGKAGLIGAAALVVTWAVTRDRR